MFESLTQSLTSVFSRWGKVRELTQENILEGLEEIRRALLEADVHFQVARNLVAKVSDRAIGAETIEGVQPAQQIIKAFSEVLTEAMDGQAPSIPAAGDKPTVIMMVGLQGSGKTTSSAKLAYKLRKQGRRPLLVAADVQRPAAIQQLQVLGEQLEVPVFAEPGGSPPKICQDALAAARSGGQDVVILDTAGRLHIDVALMTELEQVAKKAPPDLTYLVCDSMAGQDAYTSAREFHGRLSLSGLILTKLDGDTRGGAAISVREVTGKPVAFVGTGERPEDLDEFHADRMASRILGRGDVVSLVEKAQEVMDEKQAEETAERMLKAQFTFDDFLSQLKMLRRMGPLSGILKMLPGGLGQALGAAGQHENELRRVEAVILSMTAKERKRPDVIGPSRKRRIAKGSGTEVAVVNQLLRQFSQMRDMMKSLGGGGGGLFKRMGKMAGGGDTPSPADMQAMMSEGAGGLGGMPGMMPPGARAPGKVDLTPGARAERREQQKRDRKRQKQARKRNRKRR